MKVYCDMDGVLVLQTGRSRFDMMSWIGGGKEIWGAIKDLNPKLLTMLPDEFLIVGGKEKKIWAARELGAHVEVIVVANSVRKHGYAEPGALLIDDSERNCAEWRIAGGVAILHCGDLASTLSQIQFQRKRVVEITRTEYFEGKCISRNVNITSVEIIPKA